MCTEDHCLRVGAARTSSVPLKLGETALHTTWTGSTSQPGQICRQGWPPGRTAGHPTIMCVLALGPALHGAQDDLPGRPGPRLGGGDQIVSPFR